MPLLERRAPRHKVLLAAEISESRNSAPTRHRVRDISAAGARVDAADSLAKGSNVVVTLGSLRGVAATVAWAQGGDAGLSFESEINPEDARSRPANVTLARPLNPATPVTRPAARVTAGWAAHLNDPYKKGG